MCVEYVSYLRSLYKPEVWHPQDLSLTLQNSPVCPACPSAKSAVKHPVAPCAWARVCLCVWGGVWGMLSAGKRDTFGTVPAPRGASLPSADRDGSAAHRAPPGRVLALRHSPHPPKFLPPVTANLRLCTGRRRKGSRPTATLLLPFLSLKKKNKARSDVRSQGRALAPRTAAAASAPRPAGDGAAGTGLCP